MIIIFILRILTTILSSNRYQVEPEGGGLGVEEVGAAIVVEMRRMKTGKKKVKAVVAAILKISRY